MVRAWGPVTDANTVEALLPTLRAWVRQLASGPGPARPAGPTSPADLRHDPAAAAPHASSGSSRPRFRPPASAVWRALHGLLPLLQGEAAAALLPALPGLASAVIAGVGGPCGAGLDATPRERELCRWFAVGCWSRLLAASGVAALDHSHLSAEEAVQALLAAATLDGGSERLHKAAAEAVAATMLQAAGSVRACRGAEAALRRGLLFLLHDIPHGAAAAMAASRSHQQQGQAQPGRPGYSQLTAAVAEAAAFGALLLLLQRRGHSAAAALCCAHFWLQPLCAALRAQRAERSPILYAAAHTAAVQLATACVAAEVAALGGAASSLPGADPEVAAVAAAAAQQPHSWQCLPALWRALVQVGSGSSSEAQQVAALLLAAAAALAAAKGSGGGAAPASLGAVPAVPGAFGAGFTTPGLTSSLAADIEAAQRLPSQAELRSELAGQRECCYVLCCRAQRCMENGPTRACHSLLLSLGAKLCRETGGLPRSLSTKAADLGATCRLLTAPHPCCLQVPPPARPARWQWAGARHSWQSSCSRRRQSCWRCWLSVVGAQGWA